MADLPAACARHFLPPYLLERIASSGSSRLSECARHTLLVDGRFRARAGAVALPQGSARRGEPARYVYSAEQRQTLPGTLVRREGEGDSGDLAVDEAYRGLGATYRLFWEAYERHSIDDDGMALLATVHYGQDYENAFWDGRQMVFGDGDGELFNRFTVALDIVAHELSHGVIQHEAALTYAGQSGALNESLCDVFGSLVKQRELGQSADEADWLIGEGLFTDRIAGSALRSMAKPGSAYDDPLLGRDPQPGHMDAFVVTDADHGGVHINSGIPNRAFHLVAMALGGHAWERAGRIWYDTLIDTRLRQDSDFVTFASLTLDNAERRFGAASTEAEAVREGWRDVGVLP
ncbi:peptidase M4 family protein [Halomonas sp. MCCC 1A11036]|uniref:Neutral metalloproteinase n=1 Tax=Billgrantia zhangzhouensis TaxID=2733481 RepID=A0ABS9AFP2_9GAMM|nr:M4 family metallopeptidase [Halomonas zhangzhouensis]MCE8020559.1 peptidase M4 family protein [Halomonas zhangzhouensis]